jgi:hypothetical protein
MCVDCATADDRICVLAKPGFLLSLMGISLMVLMSLGLMVLMSLSIVALSILSISVHTLVRTLFAVPCHSIEREPFTTLGCIFC